MLKIGALSAVCIMLATSLPMLAADDLSTPVAYGSLRPPLVVDNDKQSTDEDAKQSGFRAGDRGAIISDQSSGSVPSEKETKTKKDKKALASRMPVDEDQTDDILPAPKAASKKKLVADNSKTDQGKGNGTGQASSTDDSNCEPPVFCNGSSAPGSTKFASFMFGSIFGTPIAMVRACGADLKRGATVLSQQHTSNKVLVGVIGTAIFPFTVVSGILQGPFLGPENAFKSDPFSKDAFSLGQEFQ